MQKPNNYDETQAGGEFTPVELGGHKLIIKQVNETKSKTGKDMIVVLFDFAEDDKQPGYFMEQFQNDIRPDKKWPNQATQYILTEDAEGKCTRNFKTFTTCVEHSNAGFQVQWGISSASASRGRKSAAYSGSRWTTTMMRKRKSAFFGGSAHWTRLRMLPFLI